MAASGKAIAVTSVLRWRSVATVYRDSSPALKICAAKTWDSLLKYSYSWKKPKMCRIRAGRLAQLPSPQDSSPLDPRDARPAEATSASSQNESKGLRISPAKGSP